MNKTLLHDTLLQHRGAFLGYFAAITEQDVGLILAGESEVLLELLQARYGCTQPEAKVAWNDFVLRFVDGFASDGFAWLEWPAQTNFGRSLVNLH
jgi:hypothetical protein